MDSSGAVIRQVQQSSRFQSCEVSVTFLRVDNFLVMLAGEGLARTVRSANQLFKMLFVSSTVI